MKAGKFVNGGKYYRYVGDVVLSRFVTIFTLFDRLALMIEFSTIQTKDSFLLSRSGRKVFVCLEWGAGGIWPTLCCAA